MLPKHVPLTDRYAPRPTVRGLASRDWEEKAIVERIDTAALSAVSSLTGVESRRAGMRTRPHLGEGPISEVRR